MIHDSRTQERFWAKVSKTDTCWEWTASRHKAGYGAMMRWVDGKKKPGYAHRISYEIHFGSIAPGLVVDHICHNKSCVNPEHLRAITQRENTQNKGCLNSNNTSGFRGVWWDANRNQWAAETKHRGKKYFAGRHTTRADAEAAARAKRLELHTFNDLDRAT